MNIAQELTRVAKEVISDNTGLALEGLRNEKARRIVGDLLRPFTKGTFTDQYWAPVNKMWEVLNNANINWELKKAEYSHGNDGATTGKDWRFEVYFTNNNGRFTTLYGNIRAAWCGSCKDPSERYDLVSMVD